MSDDGPCALAAALSAELTAVASAVVPGELVPDWPMRDPIVIAFGPVLTFGDGSTVFVTWRQLPSAISPDPAFGLKIETSIVAPNDHLALVDASESRLFRDLLSSRLAGFRLLGRSGTPHLLECSFGGTSVFMANGTLAFPGESDDIIVSRQPLDIAGATRVLRHGGAV